jgi:hypothetical protein
MGSLRWPRLLAGLIDFAPFAIAVCLVTPSLVTLGVLAYESYIGIGFFDPTTGGDPVAMAYLAGQRPLVIGALIGALSWTAIEAMTIAHQRAWVGQSICRLLVQRHDGQEATLARRLLRGSVREAIALALLATAALVTRPAPPALPRRYLVYSPNPPPPPLISAEHLAPLALALAGALVLALAIDLVLALAGARSLGDRIADTALQRR